MSSLYCPCEASIFSKKAPFFYKAPHSQFASGQLSEEELEAKKIRTETLSAFQVLWEGKEFSFKQDEIVREIQVAELAQARINTPLFATPKFSLQQPGNNPSSTNKIQVNKDEIVLVTELINSNWAQVQKLSEKKISGYLPLDYLQSFSEDTGKGFTITSIYLKENANDDGKIITTIPQRQTVKILAWEKNKVLVSYKNFKGYIDPGLLFLKADFASMALHKNKGWLQVKYREGLYLRTISENLLPIDEFKAFITNKYRAFSLINQEQGPKLRSRLEIKNLQGDYWSVSLIPEHGEVWWKKVTSQSTELTSSESLSTEQILKRQIYSMAFYPQSQIKGLISASGVFKTTDGKTWEKIDFFKNENWPVAITNSKIWIVGHYQSLNEGKSFEPFIRWEKLSQLVEDQYTLTPKFLKLLKLESKKNDLVEFTMDTGFKKVKLSYDCKKAFWQIAKP